MRKLLTSVSAIAIAGGLAYGIARSASPGTLPFVSGPTCSEPSQEIACLNALIQNIYSGVTGNFAYVGPTGNSGGGTTTANFTFASALIPTGTALAANSGYRARCAGISGVSTTMKVGIAAGRSMAVSLENFGAVNNVIGAEPNWDLELEFHTVALQTTATPSYGWMGRGFAAQATGTATSQMAVISGNDITVTDNTINFGVPITCVVYGGVATGFVTMMNFSVEQLR